MSAWPSLRVTGVRHAEPEDLPLIAHIESESGRRFSDIMDTSDWAEPATGEERASAPGVLLVAGQPAAGFAHVRVEDGHFHLDEISVHPDFQRRGLASMLLSAAYGVVLDAGGDTLTLTTFAAVPWNGPWYQRHGFTILPEPHHEPLATIRQLERARGYDSRSPRVAMSRRILDHPQPIPAVSVLPVRDGDSGLEVFVQHRVATMDFAAGAVVFPGGRIDPGDRQAGASLDLPQDLLETHIHAWKDTAYRVLGDDETAARTLLATALREVHEETGAQIDPIDLIPWDDWETPVGGPKRFDVRFFLLPVRDDRAAARFGHTTTEAHRSEWMPVIDVAAGVEDGSLTLVTPTRVLIEELLALPSVAHAVALCPPVTLVRHDITPTPRRRGRLTPITQDAEGG